MIELPDEIVCTRRRRTPRIPAEVPLFYHGSSDSGRSYTVDISLTGARISTCSPLADEEVHLTLNLAQHASVTVVGRQVWSAQNGNGQQVGLEFVNLGVGGRAALARWLNLHAPPPIPLPAPRWANPLAWTVGSCGGPRGLRIP